MSEHPLWLAIKRLKSAKRRKAHPRIIERLEMAVKKEAGRVADILGGKWPKWVQDIRDKAEADKKPRLVKDEK